MGGAVAAMPAAAWFGNFVNKGCHFGKTVRQTAQV
jgi:hypothetical protein